MKTITKTLITGITVLALTACGSSGGDGDSAQDQAIDKIANYAQNAGAAPTLQDYLDAGVTGITNLDAINDYVLGLTKEDVDTTQEIQAIADELGVEITANIPPIAKAEADLTNVTEGENVYFTSSLSTDTDGSIVSYKWQEGGTTLADVPSFDKSDFSVGTHTVTLTVTDNEDATDMDTLTITVTAPAQTCLELGEYGTVELANGQIWLDRNLGASAGGVGDYYQWGRTADGHEKLTADTTTVQATTLDPGHGDFINNPNWTTTDSVGTQRQEDWSTANDPRQVCPCGFIVPSYADAAAMGGVDYSTLNFPDSAEVSIRELDGSISLPYAELDGSISSRYAQPVFGWYATTDSLGHAFLVETARISEGITSASTGMNIRCIDASTSIAPQPIVPR